MTSAARSSAWKAIEHTVPYGVIFEELSVRGKMPDVPWREQLSVLESKRGEQVNQRDALAAATAELTRHESKRLLENKVDSDNNVLRMRKRCDELKANIAKLEQECDAIERHFRSLLHAARPASLCLSGGGIRSASFSLGVIQELARYSVQEDKPACLMAEFDYVSTVSGGGYTGSWLSAWSKWVGFRNVIDRLAQLPTTSADPETREVRHLREYSNFLAPHPGILSTDSWTLFATYLRNLLLILLLLVPLLTGVLLLPHYLLKIIEWSVKLTSKNSVLINYVTLASAFSVILATVSIWFGLPDSRSDQSKRAHSLPFKVIASTVVLSAFALAFLFAVCGGFLPDTRTNSLGFAGVPLWIAAVAVSLLYCIGDWIRVRQRRWTMFTDNCLSILGVLGGAGLLLAAFMLIKRYAFSFEGYLAVSVPLVLLVYMIAGSVMNGLKSGTETEEEREWWARSGACLFMISAGWLVLFGLVLYASDILNGFRSWFPASRTATMPTATAIVGAIGSWLGFSAATPATSRGPDWDKLSKVGKLLRNLNIAAAGLAIAFFLLLVLSLAEIGQWFVRSFEADPVLDLIALLGCVGISFFLAFRVNINAFSMNGMYRSRLVRAFMGASNDFRWPFPFINFDPGDNFYCADMQPGTESPIHVVNFALNVVKAKKLAWQERKAEPFTVTPLHAGSFRLGYRTTEKYAGTRGMTLGTAMAISGAAANPNMGYNSSAVTTLLMTFFNVRLGWWLPNPGPAGERNWHRPGPFFALQPLIFEAMGNTTDDRAWVNVSDGGHFENLGLYEMVLRRSHTIVVVDGSADPKFRLDDLANASRKIFVDFGIPIDFSSIKVGRDQDCLHCAVGIIRYSCVDGSHTPDGTVVYIKTSLNHNEPIDVQNYARLHPEFPHESTADQFFSEAQLESYRRLGAHVVSEILDPEATRRPAPVTLEQFVSAAVAYAKPDNPASKVFRFEIATSN